MSSIDGAHSHGADHDMGHGVDGARHGAFRNDYGGDGAPESVIDGLGDKVDCEGNLVDLSHHDDNNASDAHGQPLNVNASFDAAEAMGIDAERFVDDFVNDRNNGGVSNFKNDDLSMDEKYVGAVAALNAFTIGQAAGGDFGNDVEAARENIGEAVNAADAGDYQGLLGQLSPEAANVPEEALMNVFSSEMHPIQHLYLNDKSNVYELTHSTNMDVNATGEKAFSNGNNDAYQGNNALGDANQALEDYGELYLTDDIVGNPLFRQDHSSHPH